MVALVGLRYHGSELTWMALDLDWPNRHGVGTTEIHGHSLDGATGPREPGRRLSRVPTDDERVLPMVSSGLAVNAERACYRDPSPTNSQDNSSLIRSRNRISLARDVAPIFRISHPASRPFDHWTI